MKHSQSHGEIPGHRSDSGPVCDTHWPPAWLVSEPLRSDWLHQSDQQTRRDEICLDCITQMRRRKDVCVYTFDRYHSSVSCILEVAMASN